MENLSEQSRHYHEAYAESGFPPGSPHRYVLEEVGSNAHVLELGPSTGYMTRALRAQGCTVVGIELDPAAAERAAEYSERMIVGDLDDLATLDQLADERFDVVVAADVLEHLRTPDVVLERLVGHLNEGGRIVVSLPNITHVTVRIALMQGRFPYGPVGLLDHTHLRFFDREGVLRLFEDAGLAVGRLHRRSVPLEESSVPFERDAIAERVIAESEHDEEAQTYQFIAVGFPADASVLHGLGARLRELNERADQTQALQYQLNSLRQTAHDQALEIDALAQQLTAGAQRELELRRLFQSSEEQLLERDRLLVQLRPGGERDQLLAERNALAEAEAYFRTESEIVHRRLAAVEGSRAWAVLLLARRVKKRLSS